jgi:hypothetical protein
MSKCLSNKKCKLSEIIKGLGILQYILQYIVISQHNNMPTDNFTIQQYGPKSDNDIVVPRSVLPRRRTLRLYRAFTSDQAPVLSKHEQDTTASINIYSVEVYSKKQSVNVVTIDDQAVRHVLCICQLWAVRRRMAQAIAGN